MGDHDLHRTKLRFKKPRVWDVILGSVVLVLVMVAVLIWAWHPSGPDAPTEWLCVVTGILALVTTALATATIVTARQAAITSEIAMEDLRLGQRLVEATNEQAITARKQSELSEQALSDSRRPILIPEVDTSINNPKRVRYLFDHGQINKDFQEFPVVGYFVDDNSEWVILKIRNVGNGPAIIKRDTDSLSLNREGFDVNEGFAHSRVIASGDVVALTFHLSRVIEPVRFWISVTYSDLSYGRLFRGTISFDENRPFPRLVDATVEDLNLVDDHSRVGKE